MADKNREDYLRETEEAARKQADEDRDARDSAADEATSWADESGVREADGNGPLTGEEAAAHRATVAGTMIFGDTDTTAGAAAAGTDVPSADNESATVEVAQKDSAAALGDEEAAETSDQEARRQVDIDAGTTESAEEVDEAAAEQDADESSDGDVAADADDDEEENLTPAQKAARTRARNRAESGE